MKDKARLIIGFVEDACGDMAFEQSKYGGLDEETKQLIKKMKGAGVKDIPGSLADYYYNDPEFCEDMLGDRIYGDAEGDAQNIVILAEAVKELSTCQAMKTACDEIIRRWKS
jgi:hypothetical protein